MILATRHTGINVTSLGRAFEFYNGLLGLVLVEMRTEKGEYIDRLTGLSHVDLSWIKVGSPDGVLVELVRFNPPRSSQPRDYATIGCNHLCFTVDNVDTLHGKLTAAGVECHPVQTDPLGKVKNMACLDPDGTIIELVEEL